MPLKSGGAVENEKMRGRTNAGLISMGKGVIPFESIVGFDLLINEPQQISALYSSPYFVVFYRDPNDGYIHYKKSTDTRTWTEPTQGNPASDEDVGDSRNYSIWYDGVYVNLVWTRDVAGAAISFKRGTISLGEITWGTTYTVTSHAPYTLRSPAICKTHDGFLWVTYHNVGLDLVYVVKSTQTDGSAWQARIAIDAILTQRLSCPIPLSTNSVYVVYSDLGAAQMRGRTYDGSSLGSIETIMNLAPGGNQFSAVHGSLGVIHVCIWDGAGVSWRRRIDSTWQSAVAIAVANLAYEPVLARADTNKILIFYNDGDSGKMYEKHWLGGNSWSNAQEIGSTLIGVTSLGRGYSSVWGQVVWLYVQNGTAILKHYNFDTSTISSV